MRLSLEEICDFINGGPWSESEYSDIGIRVVKVSNMVDGTVVPRHDDNYLPVSKYDKYRKHELRANDLIVATVGSHPTQPGSVVGRTSLVPGDYSGSFLNQNAVCLRVRRSDICSQHYLFYLSNTVLFKHHIESRAQGSANQVRMAVGELKKFTVDYPSLACQRKIAGILSSYDELIENHRRRIALLEHMADEIYREWFVRLRFPGHEQISVVKGAPQGWERKCLPEIADITYGFPFDGSRFNTYGLGKPIVRIRNIPESSTIDYTDETVDEKYIVRHGDLLVGMDGEFHINCWHGDDAYLVQRVCRIKAKQPALEGYLSHAIRAPIKHLESILMGATVGHLGAMHLKNMVLLVPPEPLHKSLNILNDLHRERLTLATASRNLSQMRDRLLPRLISGKLSVENLDIQIPPGMMKELGQPSNPIHHA